MLTNLRIQGFKCFRDFHLRGMRRINLLAGKNGAGKSALLEAIRLYQQPGLDGLLDILDWRDELAPEHTVWTANALIPLFWQAEERASAGSTGTIRMEGEQVVELELAWHRRGEDGSWHREDSGPHFQDPSLKQRLQIRFPQRRLRPFDLALDGSVEIESPSRATQRADSSFLRYANIPEKSIVYLRSDALDSDALSELFEKIVATDREETLNEMLRWIVPDAERLVTKGSGADRAIFVKRRGTRSPEPLKRFGDGAVRVAALALAIANSQGGCCLVDEVENGVHYGLLDRMWEKLSLMSKAFDVQIFASTHSKDCIEAFERSFRLTDFDSCFYRLERAGDDIKAVRLDHEHFFSIVSGREYEIR